MPYELFKSHVNAMISKAGGGYDVEFSHEDGKHIARISDGMTITGNTISTRVSVSWGSGHVANATI